MLNVENRHIVKCEIENHCNRRGWKTWVANPRTNHVHVVITTPGDAGDKVCDQLKANCTRGIREADGRFVDRPVWTTKGEVQNLDTEDDLELAIMYAGEAQDRMSVEYVSRGQPLGDCFG